jgi:hypothetical protein|uniref:Uncharacterized protein n=1 Tax=Zea mays TaxID=4577 RepID=B8A257_MAIZE|nr:unknown [Zea mays]
MVTTYSLETHWQHDNTIPETRGNEHTREYITDVEVQGMDQTDLKILKPAKQDLYFCVTTSHGYSVLDVLGGFSFGCFDP